MRTRIRDLRMTRAFSRVETRVAIVVVKRDEWKLIDE